MVEKDPLGELVAVGEELQDLRLGIGSKHAVLVEAQSHAVPVLRQGCGFRRDRSRQPKNPRSSDGNNAPEDPERFTLVNDPAYY